VLDMKHSSGFLCNLHILEHNLSSVGFGQIDLPTNKKLTLRVSVDGKAGKSRASLLKLGGSFCLELGLIVLGSGSNRTITHLFDF